VPEAVHHEDESAPPALTANESAVLRTLANFDPAELAW
jgi:hypothetical protein